MLRFSSAEVLDLLATRNTAGDDHYVCCGGFDCRHEAAVADLRRQLIMFLFKTERPRHAAAAGIDFAHVVTRGFEHRHCRSGADKSLLMAVAVEQSLLFLTVRPES